MGKKSKPITRKRKIETPEEEEKHNEVILEEVSNISGKNVEKADGSPPARLKRSANKMKEKPLAQEKKVATKKVAVSLSSSSPSKMKKNPAEEKEDNNVVDDIKTSTSERGVSVSNLPDGWRREAVVRKSGKTAGQVDIYFYSPDGTKLRSRPDVTSYLTKHNIDLKIEEFNFSKTVIAETVIKEKDSSENSAAPKKKIKTMQDEIIKDGVELKDSSKPKSTKKSRASEKSSSDLRPATVNARKRNNSERKPNKIVIRILDSKPKRSRK